MSNQFQLLKERRFLPFFCTQFLGAFNDNVFKTALITLVIFKPELFGLKMDSKALSNLLPGLFILPFFLFSATSGQVADKMEKSKLIRWVKLLEIGIMILAALGFLTHSFIPLVGALFLMGLHSTLFGPVKYSYLPQHLAPDELVGGNGLIEMGTFVAILLGQVLGAALASLAEGAFSTSAIVMGLAVAGYFVSRGVPLSPAQDPGLRINWNPITETWNNLRNTARNRVVWLSILGISWFWFYGAIILAQFPTYAKTVLGGDESVFILLLTTFSLGVGSGSLLCEKLSGHKVEIGLVPFGAIGLTVFGADLFLASPASVSGPLMNFQSFLMHPSHWRIIADTILIGLFGGLYIVPLYALIQTRSEKSHQSRVIAANNILNALFMVASAGVAILFLNQGLSIPQLFLVTALLNAAVALYIYMLVPEFLVRFLSWILLNLIYRLKKEGTDHIPTEGPVFLVSNHTSYIDFLVILSAYFRPIRFVVDEAHFRRPVLGSLLRASRAIPYPMAKSDEAMRAQALEEIRVTFEAGDPVGLFPEGEVNHVQTLGELREDLISILRSHSVPILPIQIQGLWNSFFAPLQGSALQGVQRFHPWRKVHIRVGKPLEKSLENLAQAMGNWAAD